MCTPRQGCSTSRSSSLLIIVSAPAARPNSRYLLSFASLQSAIFRLGSNQTPVFRKTFRMYCLRSNEIRRANLGRPNTSAISAITGLESANTSVSSARSSARSGTLSSLSAAPTKVEASKTINRRDRRRGALRCMPPAPRRCLHRSDQLLWHQPSSQR